MLGYVLAIVIVLAQVLLTPTEAWSKSATRDGATARSVKAQKAVATKRASIRRVPRKAVRENPAPRVKATRAKTGRTVAVKTKAVRVQRQTVHRHATRATLARPWRSQAVVRPRATMSATDPPNLSSNSAFIFDPQRSEVLFEKNADEVMPIASITKLMTALVVVEAGQDMDEVLTVTAADVDRLKHTSSRLRVGARLTRANMLQIALMSSENRAASALGRHYPGGLPAFVAAMNAKTKALGMLHTRYVEPTGLSSQNVSTANDLAKLVMAAQAYPVIRRYSTQREYAVAPGGPILQYRNSNRLVASSQWDILLQKTGYIAEAGRCLVMNARIDGRAIVMVFLDAKGKFSRATDAGRVRQWLERPQM